MLTVLYITVHGDVSNPPRVLAIAYVSTNTKGLWKLYEIQCNRIALSHWLVLFVTEVRKADDQKYHKEVYISFFVGYSLL